MFKQEKALKSMLYLFVSFCFFLSPPHGWAPPLSSRIGIFIVKIFFSDNGIEHRPSSALHSNTFPVTK